MFSTLYSQESINNNGVIIGSHKFMNSVYFHGVLEKKIGHDLVSVSASNELNFIDGEGIYNVCIYHFDGEDHVCYAGILFYWQTETRMLGIVIMNSDTQNISYAWDKYYNKSDEI